MQPDPAEITPLADQLERELSESRRASSQEPVEPTEAERRNGWTAESLTRYLSERQAGQSLAVDVNSLHRRVARRPDEQNHRYCPHRWRG